MRSLRYDAAYWYSRAEEARSLAEIITDVEARRLMSVIADGYERLAELAGLPVPTSNGDGIDR